ncbi:FecR family protein [Sphingobacterium sp. NGMCC 1.201703]|uniref:FecR family protein n=1 Tax=Sphingobacterium sp. NGMCC 1.201703 TaxID=3388657 RepID=UPI0039FD1BA7
MKIDDSIFARYQAGKCSAAEQLLVERWLDQLDRFPEPVDTEMLTLLENLDSKMPFIKKRRRQFGWKWLAAASIIVMLTTTVYIYWGQRVEQGRYASIDAIHAPIKSNAIVVLENNTEYDLDKLKRNDTLNTGNYRIVRTQDDEIIYLTDPAQQSKIVYNTIRTKTGGTAHVQLADGTKVWLNTNSELRYPISFGAEIREVALRGEGYFEVAKQERAGRRVPFFVRGNTQTIQVLGTKFNADFTSNNETALLEGAVAFSNQGSSLEQTKKDRFSVRIRPNQVYDGRKIIEARDISRYIDWKEGYFDLNDLNVGQLSRKLSAWYGVEIRVDNSLAQVRLFGRVRRDKSLKEVLDLLGQVHPMNYTMKNNYIYIK